MTHIAAPCHDHDPRTGVSCTWPDLTDTQRQVIDVLGFDPGHGVCVRLTVAEMATVDAVVRWAQRLQDGSGTAGVQRVPDWRCGRGRGHYSRIVGIMSDYYRQECTRTVVRHAVATPVVWTDVQKLLRTVIRDMGYGGDKGEPADDLIWYEAGDDEIALCYELLSGSNGGPSNSERLL